VSTTGQGDTIDTRWMVSVLGRGGVLVDPQDLVYVIGGYTYARSEAFGTSFGLNGATIGAGWERQLAAGWTLRGEYRFSKFQSKDVTKTFASSDVGTSRNGTGVVTGVQTDSAVTTQTAHVAADMHSLWLGVAHSFGH
jgi:opacity protein-like surface antigen